MTLTIRWAMSRGRVIVMAAGVAAVVTGLLAAGVPAAAAATAHRTHHPVPAAIGRGLGGNPAAQKLSQAQLCSAVAGKAGFSYNNYISTPRGSYPVIVVAVAVGLAESSCNPSASASNPPTSGCPNGSTDRGLWQINNCYHAEVSNACAYQAQCNADAAFNISGHGYNWSQWSTYSSGAFGGEIGLAEQSIYGVTVQLESNGDGTCLDADASSVGNGGKIFQWSCNSADRYQQWTITGSIGRVPILRNAGSGTCLDADGNDVGNGGKIFQWSCNTNDSFQQWWFYGSGQYNTNGHANAGLHNVGTRSTCLDADGSSRGNGAPIFQWSCNQNDVFQQWN
ncbi:MAG TPA: ricin-type beta-trefoil lectin domain protein [Streptosporangiaceae bacterium]|nr:ricin-type beta-trefoil lectin domain protein [Streptosporangiaceae bacterium]